MLDSAMLRTIAHAGLAVFALSLGYMPGEAAASPQSTAANRPPAAQSTTSQPATPGQAGRGVGTAQLAVRLLREGVQAGQVGPDDMLVKGLHVLMEIIPTRISAGITDPAAREAALARVRESSHLLDTTVMPALKKAAASADAEDLRMLMPLLDQLEGQLADIEKSIPPAEDPQVRQMLLDADTSMRQSLLKAADLAASRQCALRMTSVLKAMATYITKHKGRFPATLGDLYQDIMVSRPGASPARIAEIFLCPNDMKKLTIPTRVTPEWINGNTSYVYLGSAALTDDADPGAIILHEKVDAGHDEYINVGYVDTHVRSLPRSEVEGEMTKSRRLLAPRTDDHH